MKTTRYILGAALAGLLLMFASCDKIKDNNRLIDQGVVEIKSERCVLLEDYTGVGCRNCPEVAAEIQKLQAAYGTNLIALELHPKNFSLTKPLDTKDEDLRTEEAQIYADAFQVAGLPSGVINRRGQVLTSPQALGGAVQDVFDDTISDYANMLASAKLSSGGMQVSINGNFKKDYTSDGEIRVIVMIVEDGIRAPQVTSTNVDVNYIHNHVLREVISDVWGDKVLDEHPAQNEDFTKTYTNVTLNANWKTENLALVVVLVNARTREVLQAAYAHLQ